MLTVEKKATILAKTGSVVPPFPIPGLQPADVSPSPGSDTSNPCGTDVQHIGAVARWKRDIEVLYSYYTAARAAKSLRDAESIRQLGMLRRAAARLP